MRSRKLKSENITKAFRRFSGDLSIQIDGKRWITIVPTKDNGQKTIDEFIRARNTNKLDYVEINEDKEIVDLQLKKKDTNQEIVDKVKKIYRHG